MNLPSPTVLMKLKLVCFFAYFKIKLHRKSRSFPSRNKARVNRDQELWALEFSLCGPPGNRHSNSDAHLSRSLVCWMECLVVTSHSYADLWTSDLGSSSSERIERKWAWPFF